MHTKTTASWIFSAFLFLALNSFFISGCDVTEDPTEPIVEDTDIGYVFELFLRTSLVSAQDQRPKWVRITCRDLGEERDVCPGSTKQMEIGETVSFALAGDFHNTLRIFFEHGGYEGETTYVIDWVLEGEYGRLQPHISYTRDGTVNGGAGHSFSFFMDLTP